MKILFVNTWMHKKNMHSLMNYKNIEITIIYKISDIERFDLSVFDLVYSPTEPIDVSKYPNVYFLFGPHFSVFPDYKLSNIQSNKSLYIMPSQWCVDDWKKNPLCENLNMISCPFGVDTIVFNETKPIQKRQNVFIYYKSRHPEELAFMEKLLMENSILYKVFNYNISYDENEYLDYLRESKFGVWIGRHESQGFALEEALSCNVPLLVWNVKSMNQEYGQRYANIPATAIPYWDDVCGEYFYDMSDFEEKCRLFFSKLELYRPRDYVLEKLSMHVCEKQFMNIVSDFKNRD
jgi:hypothetical protein